MSSPDHTVELEVCYWRESRATGENLTLVFILRWEDVGAQVPTIILGEKGREVGIRNVNDSATKTASDASIHFHGAPPSLFLIST